MPGLSTGAPCGLWISVPTADYVFYDPDTSRLHAEHIVLHELAHMLSGHSMDRAGLKLGGHSTDRAGLKLGGHSTDRTGLKLGGLGYDITAPNSGVLGTNPPGGTNPSSGANPPSGTKRGARSTSGFGAKPSGASEPGGKTPGGGLGETPRAGLGDEKLGGALGDETPGAGQPGEDKPGDKRPGASQPGAGTPSAGRPGAGEPGDKTPDAGGHGAGGHSDETAPHDSQLNPETANDSDPTSGLTGIDATGLSAGALARLLPDLDPRTVRTVLGRVSYTTSQEREAEMLASLIRARAAEPVVSDDLPDRTLSRVADVLRFRP